MTLSRTLAGTLFAALTLTVAAPGPADAQTFASEQAPRRTLYVPRDKSLSFRLPQAASRIVVAQPEIAKLTATSDRSFYVQGIEFGSTNLLIYGPGGGLSEVVDVRVGFDADGLQQDLAAAFPGEPLRVANLGESVLLKGEVSSTGVQAGAEKMAERYAPDGVISRITVRASQQVILEVRILEASRSALQDIGVDLDVISTAFTAVSGNGLIGVSPPQTTANGSHSFGSTNVDITLRALEERGLIRTLARPNLVAVSGEKASFLAGGEFPFPVPGGDNDVTIQFREYGVKLNFQPFVQDNGWIKLIVQPEVSQLDPNNSLTVLGLTVPALTVRRANTTLELKPGDSFTMAGLFQRDYQNAVQQTPWLAEVPVLGALFRSARWKRAESELIIVVTPRLATEADRAAGPKDLPGREPAAAELFLRGAALDKPMQRGGERASR